MTAPSTSRLLDCCRRAQGDGVRLYIATNQEHLRAHWLWQTLGFGDAFRRHLLFGAHRALPSRAEALFRWVSQRALDRNRSSRCFSMTRRTSSKAPALMAGRPCCFDDIDDCTNASLDRGRMQPRRIIPAPSAIYPAPSARDMLRVITAAPSPFTDEGLDTAPMMSYLDANQMPSPDRERPDNDRHHHAFIDDKVKTNDVFLFMKGTPDFPQCGFSGRSSRS